MAVFLWYTVLSPSHVHQFGQTHLLNEQGMEQSRLHKEYCFCCSNCTESPWYSVFLFLIRWKHSVDGTAILWCSCCTFKLQWNWPLVSSLCLKKSILFYTSVTFLAYLLFSWKVKPEMLYTFPFPGLHSSWVCGVTLVKFVFHASKLPVGPTCRLFRLFSMSLILHLFISHLTLLGTCLQEVVWFQTISLLCSQVDSF